VSAGGPGFGTAAVGAATAGAADRGGAVGGTCCDSKVPLKSPQVIKSIAIFGAINMR